MVKVSAMTLRKNLGEIMDRVYHTGEEVIVLRRGKPYIKIARIENKENFLISKKKYV